MMEAVMAKTKVVRGVCTVPGCGRPHKARGLCGVHYQHHLRGVPINPEIKMRDRSPHERCSEDGCAEPVKAKGLCKMHYARLLRHGHTRFHDRKRPPKPCLIVGCENHLYAKGLCHQHYVRQGKIGQKHGLSLAELDALLESQGGSCAICRGDRNKHDPRSGKLIDFNVDHSHVTGKVRGLLCSNCNRALGLFQDNPSILRAAAAYLESHAPT